MFARKKLGNSSFELRAVAAGIFVILPMLLIAAAAQEQQPAYTGPSGTPGDYVIHNFRFASGETLPELRLHYVTLGKAERDAQGKVTNAVLILHGTSGSSKQFLVPQFAGVLFGPGQLLDINRYFIIIPDNFGHGGSTKPSEGMHARFPHYGYRHDRSPAPIAGEWAEGEPSAAHSGDVDGVHALVDVGRNLSRVCGRLNAARVLAGANRGAQSHLAQDVDGRYS